MNLNFSNMKLKKQSFYEERRKFAIMFRKVQLLT